MLKRRQQFVASAATALVMLFAASAAHAQNAVPPPSPIPPPQNVRVINKPAEPVPVTGTVSVSNLGGEPLPVRDVDNPVRHAFQVNLTIRINEGQTSNSTDLLIPAGKRLVVEYLTVEAHLFTAEQFQVVNNVSITTIVAGSVGSFRIMPSPVAGIPNRFAADRPVRIYADGGNSFHVNAGRYGGITGQAVFEFALSGHLVDIPQQ